jgi:hypothetical protein
MTRQQHSWKGCNSWNLTFRNLNATEASSNATKSVVLDKSVVSVLTACFSDNSNEGQPIATDMLLLQSSLPTPFRSLKRFCLMFSYFPAYLDAIYVLKYLFQRDVPAHTNTVSSQHGSGLIFTWHMSASPHEKRHLELLSVTGTTHSTC